MAGRLVVKVKASTTKNTEKKQGPETSGGAPQCCFCKSEERVFVLAFHLDKDCGS